MARYAYYFERNKGTVAKSQKTYGIVVDYFKKKIIAGDLNPERNFRRSGRLRRNWVSAVILFGKPFVLWI